MKNINCGFGGFSNGETSKKKIGQADQRQDKKTPLMIVVKINDVKYPVIVTVSAER